jgi:hypothetical protein
MDLLGRNVRQIRNAVSWLALGSVLFGVWLAPICASACAKASVADRIPDHCHAAAKAGHGNVPDREDHDCQKVLCSHLQVGVQTSARSELLAPTSSWAAAFLPTATEEKARHQPSYRRPELLARALGPPVPPPLFTILRT